MRSVLTQDTRGLQALRRYASASPTAAFAGQKGSNVSAQGTMSLSENPNSCMQGKYTVTLIPGDGTLVQRHTPACNLPVAHRHWAGDQPVRQGHLLCCQGTQCKVAHVAT